MNDDDQRARNVERIRSVALVAATLLVHACREAPPRPLKEAGWIQQECVYLERATNTLGNELREDSEHEITPEGDVKLFLTLEQAQRDGVRRLQRLCAKVVPTDHENAYRAVVRVVDEPGSRSYVLGATIEDPARHIREQLIVQGPELPVPPIEEVVQ